MDVHTSMRIKTMKKSFLPLLLAAVLGFSGTAQAATLSVQNLSLAGLLTSTMGSASTADKFTNDGNTFLLFINGNASSRTLTLAVQNATVNQAGYNPITVSNPTVTIPGSGTNGGIAVVGPFGQTQFNDSNGQVNYTLDTATGMTVAAIKVPRL
jgi:hypothetical protein